MTLTRWGITIIFIGLLATLHAGSIGESEGGKMEYNGGGKGGRFKSDDGAVFVKMNVI